jgi:DNA polymerase I-like protein with 3'-5' exonuclease and polymerase domains
MFESAKFLYSGKDWIDRHYGENQEDNEDFQEVLEMANESKDKMIQGVLKYMESNGIEIELSEVNHLIKKFSSSILNLYISFF